MEEPVSLQHDIFKAGRSSHRAALARCLYYYSGCLSDSGRNSGVCTSFEDSEVVNFQRELFQANPYLHRADLALALHYCGKYLRRAGHFDDSCASEQVAVKLQQEPFQANPDLSIIMTFRYMKLGIFEDACASEQRP